MEVYMADRLRALKLSTMFPAVLCVALGIFTLVRYDSVNLIWMLLGILLIVYGLAYAVGNLFGRRKANKSSDVIMGLLIAILGVWLFFHPDVANEIVSLFAAMLILMSGFEDVIFTYQLHKQKFQYWWVSLLFTLLTLGSGVLLLIKPDILAGSVVILMGISLILDGVTDFITWIFMLRASSNTDVIPA